MKYGVKLAHGGSSSLFASFLALNNHTSFELEDWLE